MSPQGTSNLGQVDMGQRLTQQGLIPHFPPVRLVLGFLQVSGSIREGNPIVPDLSTFVCLTRMLVALAMQSPLREPSRPAHSRSY